MSTGMMLFLGMVVLMGFSALVTRLIGGARLSVPVVDKDFAPLLAVMNEIFFEEAADGAYCSEPIGERDEKFHRKAAYQWSGDVLVADASGERDKLILAGALNINRGDEDFAGVVGEVSESWPEEVRCYTHTFDDGFMTVHIELTLAPDYSERGKAHFQVKECIAELKRRRMELAKRYGAYRSDSRRAD